MYRISSIKHLDVNFFSRGDYPAFTRERLGELCRHNCRNNRHEKIAHNSGMIRLYSGIKQVFAGNFRSNPDIP